MGALGGQYRRVPRNPRTWTGSADGQPAFRPATPGTSCSHLSPASSTGGAERCLRITKPWPTACTSLDTVTLDTQDTENMDWT